MIEFLNVGVSAICGFILGPAVHSAYLRSKKRSEFKRRFPWDHEEAEKD